MVNGDAPMAVAEAMDADARPLQIVKMDMQENRVLVNDEALETLCKALTDSGADVVSIVAIMGTYRSGKSFLLGLLMRYLRYMETSLNSREDLPFPLPRNEEWRCKSSSNVPLPEWLDYGHAQKMCFQWRGGMDKCTEGIWIWSRPFVLPFEGRKTAVLLMDTQGAWDAEMSKEQNATVFGLTSMLASKLIVNVQNMLTDDKIDAIDYFTTYAQSAVSGLNSDDNLFGDLEFLTRDWAWYKKGFSFQECEEMMKGHFDSFMASKVEGRKEAADRLREVFRSVSCFGLSHPGFTVLEEEFSGDPSDISVDFFQLLDEFCRHFFPVGNFPRPSAPLGSEITPGSFENVIRNFVQAFVDHQPSAITIGDAIRKVELYKIRDLLLNNLKERLERLGPENRVVDPTLLNSEGEKIRADVFRIFDDRIRPLKLMDEQEQRNAFREEFNGKLENRIRQNKSQLEGAQMKLFVFTPVAGTGVYFFSGFITGHPLIDACILVLLAYWQAKKHALVTGAESLAHPDVARGLFEDCRRFTSNRVSDLHSMSVAAQTCSPGQAVNQAKAVAMAAASAGQRLHGNNNNSGNTGNAR